MEQMPKARKKFDEITFEEQEKRFNPISEDYGL